MGCNSSSRSSGSSSTDSGTSTDVTDANDATDTTETTDAADGVDGADGQASADGTDGAESASATDGADGQPGSPIDLIVDNNRSGALELDELSEDENEDVWSASNGAVFLANIDDDQDTCVEGNTSDIELPTCNDAADDVLNGEEDLFDMAPMRIRAWPDAPDDARGALIVDSPGANYVRIFVQQAKGNPLAWTAIDPKTSFSAEELREGIELRLEGTDIVRNVATWDGYVKITLQVRGADEVYGTDEVMLRVSPVMTYHHVLDAEVVYATVFNFGSSQAFIGDLIDAIGKSSVSQPLYEVGYGDQWAQDYFETGYMSMPGPKGSQHSIRVNYRSANVDNPNNPNNPLREAGRVVFDLRGRDSAAIQQFDLSHPGQMDSLDSFGNTETIPPYSYKGIDYPLGRSYRGSVPSFYPDESFSMMMEAQLQQPPVYVDTSWLLVGHVDETATFLPTPLSERGWTIGINDPQLAWQMLEEEAEAGNGNVDMFVGKEWQGGANAEISINAVLNNGQLAAELTESTAEVEGQYLTLQEAIGIADSELVRIPYIHEKQSGYSVALQPGTANGILLDSQNFAPPEPHGPAPEGTDIFKQQLEDELAPHGITVRWTEDWDLYHRLLGEVHCGSNSTRQIPEFKWWESGR
jgi:protein-arginine deiminase